MHFLQRFWSLATIYFCVSAHLAPRHNPTSFIRRDNPTSCTLEEFWNPVLPTPKDWIEYDMNERFDEWWSEHEEEIEEYGLVTAFGIWALDTPDFGCLLDGSNVNCDFQVSCDSDSLNSMSDEDARFAYYLLKSIQNVHTYFNGQREAFETAALSAAFKNDGFAYHFDHKEERDLGSLALILGITQMIFSLGAAVAPAFATVKTATVVGSAAGASNNLFAGLNALLLKAIEEEEDDSQGLKAAELGAKMGRVVMETSKLLIEMNDLLMKGDTVANLGNMRAMLESGLWLSYGGFDQKKMIEAFSDRLTAQAINALWRAQKVFIIGGGKCGDGQGVGDGPSDGSWCRDSDNTAWYLYHWQDYHGTPVATDKQYGYIMWPHGMHDLGKGDYARITVKDVIESSVRTYEAQKAAALPGPMRFEHTAQDVLDATIEDLSSGRSFLDDAVRSPFVLTIPVANISKAANDIPTHPEIHLKDKILKPYTTDDHEHRAHFCGPIAEGDMSITRHWFQKANMHGFKSPVHECNDIEPYCIMNKFPEYGGDGWYVPNGYKDSALGLC